MEGLWNARFMPTLSGYRLKTKAKRIKESFNKDQYQDLLDIKKDHKKWDVNHKVLFRNIGLCISLLATILAFNWKSSNQRAIMDLGSIESDVNEIMDIPISEQPPPPPPKTTETFIIEEVDDQEIIEEIDVSLDIEATEETVIEEVIFAPIVEEEKIDEIFLIVEEQPTPIGGYSAFNKYVAESLRYPRSALRLGITGRVFVKFVVEKDGSITDVEVIKGIGAGCNEEAVRVVSNAPKWKPGRQRGRAVRVRQILPIAFLIKE
jgi:protein TonB